MAGLLIAPLANTRLQPFHPEHEQFNQHILTTRYFNSAHSFTIARILTSHFSFRTWINTPNTSYLLSSLVRLLSVYLPDYLPVCLPTFFVWSNNPAAEVFSVGSLNILVKRRIVLVKCVSHYFCKNCLHTCVYSAADLK